MLGALTDAVSNIQVELKEFRKETNERFDILDVKNADNHITIKGDIKNLQETVEEIEVDLKMVKKITVVNSEDIEKLTVVKQKDAQNLI